jgi:PTS system nitrogen regulatory IIA component
MQQCRLAVASQNTRSPTLPGGMQRAQRSMHGDDVPAAAGWLGMAGAYAWTVRSLARLGWEQDGERPAEVGDAAAAQRLRVLAPRRRDDGPPAAETRIADLLTADLVVPSIDAPARDDVIEALAIRVASSHPGIEAERLVDAIREREAQMTTALVDGVAIPHARLEGLDRTVAAFARSSSGIRWESLDGELTHLIFLLAGPAAQQGSYLKALAGVSRLLSHARCRARLLEAAGEAELLAVLREEEDRSLRKARAA